MYEATPWPINLKFELKGLLPGQPLTKPKTFYGAPQCLLTPAAGKD